LALSDISSANTEATHLFDPPAAFTIQGPNDGQRTRIRTNSNYKKKKKEKDKT
jgi:hypothetical protein